MSGQNTTEISPPDTFRPLKQPYGAKACVAYVGAMAAGVPVEEFVRFCRELGHDHEPYTDRQFYAFMLSQGFLCGQGYVFKDRLPRDLPERILVPLDITGQAAYLKVTCEDPRWHHAIYWDGQQIWDPRADVRDGKPPSEYEIILWVPINRIERCAG